MTADISLIDASPSFADADLHPLANALQIFFTRDFCPHYGGAVRMWYTPKGSTPHRDHWHLALLDNSDVAGALGYHDRSPTGQPLGKIFVKTTLGDGGLVSVTACHEAAEMKWNPQINRAVELDDASGAPSKFVGEEVGDPTEADSDGYDITIPAGWEGDGQKIRMSNFVLPSWFALGTSGPWDFLNQLKAPFTLRPGGYMGFLDLGNLAAGWQQQMAKESSIKARAMAEPHPGSRRARRSKPRKDWMNSTYAVGTEAPVQARTFFH